MDYWLYVAVATLAWFESNTIKANVSNYNILQLHKIQQHH